MNGPLPDKHPNFNAKKTHAVTERVLRSWCGISNAYLWSAEHCQARAAELQREPDDMLIAAGVPGEFSGWHSTVGHDCLMYGMEMTLKAAQMVDGYHGFNRGLGIPGFVENFQAGSLTYVYVRPTHRLDEIYRAEMSDRMKGALERVAPVGALLKRVYAVVYSQMFGELNWAPGRDSKGSSDILHDSLRYTNHWMSRWLDPSTVQVILTSFRKLNSVVPEWFDDPRLKIA